MRLTAIAFAVSATFSSAYAATPVSLYDYANGIKNSAIQLTFIKSMEANYTKTVATFSTLVNDKNTAKWGNQAWYQNIVEQYNWYKTELVKYQALETALTAPPPAPVPTPIATLDPTKLPVGPNAQMYSPRTGGKMSFEQYQANTVMTQIGATAAWSRGYTGKGSTIAVLDQGFNLNHNDIKPNILAYKNFYAGTISDANANWGLHGTAMASVAAGAYGDGKGTIGVAPDAQLLLGQVGQGGSMPNVNYQAVTKGLNWAQDNGAIAVNMSFSSTFDPTYIAGTTQIAPGVWQGNTKYGAMYGQVSTLNAFKSSYNTTSVILAAAGNQGLAYSGFPGAFATATDDNGNLVFGGRWLIVGSVDANNNLSKFSNAAGSICTNVVNGACQDLYSVKDFYVVAPGERIGVAMDRSASTTQTNATVMSGTSPATAMVAGGVAVIHQAWPQLKAAEIVSLIKNTATDLGAPGVDDVYGYGLVNLDKATQPYADVKYSKVQLKSGAVVSGVSLNNTGIATNGTVTSALANSNVLKNVQIVDSLNRNFTANFTKGIVGSTTGFNSFYSSPWLAMKANANTGNYRETAIPLSKDSTLTMMQVENGIASQYDTKYGTGRISFQFGAMSEANGFLNNSGSGLFAMGNSSTTYVMIGGTAPITDKIDFIGNYGLGLTKTSNANGSLLSLSPTVISDTWKLGFAKKDTFFSGKTSDQFTFALQGPASIRKGYADVTAVTGYSYSGDEFNVTATPVTSTERVNLASGTRQMNMVMGYSVSTGNTSTVGINFVRQFNAGGTPGATANGINVMARVLF